MILATIESLTVKALRDVRAGARGEVAVCKEGQVRRGGGGTYGWARVCGTEKVWWESKG